MEHELKILPKYFRAVRDETKNFELRKDDRNFKIGDMLLLQEFDGKHYTGRETTVKVTYKLNGGKFGLEEGYCILGIKLMMDEF